MESLHLDDPSWKILKGLSYTPKTPQILSRIYGIPIAECWNRVHFLEGLGLVHVVLTFLSREGKVLYFYQTVPDTVSIVLEDRPRAYFHPAW